MKMRKNKHYHTVEIKKKKQLGSSYNKRNK